MPADTLTNIRAIYDASCRKLVSFFPDGLDLFEVCRNALKGVVERSSLPHTQDSVHRLVSST